MPTRNLGGTTSSRSERSSPIRNLFQPLAAPVESIKKIGIAGRAIFRQHALLSRKSSSSGRSFPTMRLRMFINRFDFQSQFDAELGSRRAPGMHPYCFSIPAAFPDRCHRCHPGHPRPELACSGRWSDRAGIQGVNNALTELISPTKSKNRCQLDKQSLGQFVICQLKLLDGGDGW